MPERGDERGRTVPDAAQGRKPSGSSSTCAGCDPAARGPRPAERRLEGRHRARMARYLRRRVRRTNSTPRRRTDHARPATRSCREGPGDSRTYSGPVLTHAGLTSGAATRTYSSADERAMQTGIFMAVCYCGILMRISLLQLPQRGSGCGSTSARGSWVLCPQAAQRTVTTADSGRAIASFRDLMRIS